MTTTETALASPVVRRDEQGITTLTLNRPGAYNTLSSATIAALS
ncbi:MAG: enoyl-CoA hydratase, partial [Gammaproteobacteria bacterium]|nr:enoyl-CoA hydratase [Gammaproteobacteria bacterium]